MTDLVLPQGQADLFIVMVELEAEGFVTLGDMDDDKNYRITAAGAAWGSKHGCRDLSELVSVYAKRHNLPLPMRTRR